MSRIRLQFMLFLLLAGCLSLASGSLAEAQQDQGQAPAAASPTGRAEISPGQVSVTYVDGRLTIKANKAPLSQILREVCAQIGVQLEFTSGSDEPVFADLGPGPAKKVLVSLLEGAPYNYVMRSADNPDLVTSLTVSPRNPETGEPLKQAPVAQAQASEPKDKNSTSKTPIAATANSRAKQLKDLLITAKDEVAKARVSMQGENVGASPTDVNINDVLDQLDAQLSAVAETGAASPSQTQQQPDPAAGNAVGRPRHRRR